LLKEFPWIVNSMAGGQRYENAEPIHQAGRAKARPLCQTLGIYLKRRPTIPFFEWRIAVHLERTKEIQNISGMPAPYGKR